MNHIYLSASHTSCPWCSTGFVLRPTGFSSSMLPLWENPAYIWFARNSQYCHAFKFNSLQFWFSCTWQMLIHQIHSRLMQRCSACVGQDCEVFPDSRLCRRSPDETLHRFCSKSSAKAIWIRGFLPAVCLAQSDKMFWPVLNRVLKIDRGNQVVLFSSA